MTVPDGKYAGDLLAWLVGTGNHADADWPAAGVDD